MVGTVINEKANDALPLATRNYVQLTLLAPGSVHPDPSSMTNGSDRRWRTAIRKRQPRAGQQLHARWSGQ